MIQKINNYLKNQLYTLSLYIRKAAGTIVLLVIARYLSVYDYGLFSSYKSIAVFLLIFANLSFSDYILVSSKANTHEVKLKITLFLTYAIALVLLILTGSCFYNFESKILFDLVLIRTFFDITFFALILPYFQATKKFNTIGIINIIYSAGTALIAIFSYIFKLSLLKFLVLSIILGVINFIHCSLYAKLNYILLFNFAKRILLKIDKTIFYFIGLTIATQLYGQIAPLFIAIFINKKQAALFFAAATIASIIQLMISAQTQKMVPELINNSVENIKEILFKNLKFILIITSIFFVFMIFAGKLILKLVYGQDYYTNAYGVLLILLISNIVYAESAIFGAYIVASNNVNKILKFLIQASIIATLSLVLLHKFGIYAAAVSLLLATAYLAYKYTKFVLNLLSKIEIKGE
jgi:O-antigen/teichoic acid export membrane protein